MANQIEMFFRNEPERANAVKAVAKHIHACWEPRMRKEIIAYVQAGGAGLGSIATDAVKALPPISKRWGGPVSQTQSAKL